MRDCKIIGIMNQKGGVGKTTTCINLAAALKLKGYNVLLVDCDPQRSTTKCLGLEDPDHRTPNINTLMENVVNDQKIDWQNAVLTHEEGFDFIPSCIQLSAMEMSLQTVLSREIVLQTILDLYREYYDYILIDTSPSLNLLAINAMAASDSILIPVATEDMAVDGIDLLISSITKIKRKINPDLTICGILPTIVESRTRDSKEIVTYLRETYESRGIRVFKNVIPKSVEASRIPRYNKSIFSINSTNKVALAYDAVAEEVIELG